MKTTKKQFSLFKKEALLWLEIFGLEKIWTVKISLVKVDGDIAGQCWWKYSGKIARIVLNTELPEDDYDDESIRRTAFHEVCELLLAETSSIAQARFNVCEEDHKRATHCVIRVLETVLFKKRKELCSKS